MSRSALIVTLLSIMGAAAASAEPLDPYIHIGDPPAGTPVGTTFGVTSNLNGGGVFYFVNASNVTFTSLDFFVTLPSADVITCVAQPFFSSCSFSQTPVGDALSRFDIGADSGPQGGGIAPNTFFDIILNDPIDGADNLDPNGKGGWGPGTPISVVANLDAVPEPATWGLVASALFAAVACARKRRASGAELRDTV